MGVASRYRRRLARLSALAAAALLSAGCALGPLFQPDSHTVERGDTLYSIAWRYHVDWKKLAEWNGIEPPYRIYPGQTLYLERPAVRRGASTRDGDTGKREKAASEPSSRTVAVPGRTGSADIPVWRWPLDGELSRGYSARHARRGIDIAGDPGEAVRAAAPGRVVYSGSGLKGYGNLVIIKHDERYLSAYGFNRRLRVAQGDDVAAGQHIADLGVGPENRPMLYFEIRHDGEPVDPQRLLPKK